jgi:hypothetical protein
MADEPELENDAELLAAAKAVDGVLRKSTVGGVAIVLGEALGFVSYYKEMDPETLLTAVADIARRTRAGLEAEERLGWTIGDVGVRHMSGARGCGNLADRFHRHRRIVAFGRSALTAILTDRRSARLTAASWLRRTPRCADPTWSARVGA